MDEFIKFRGNLLHDVTRREIVRIQLKGQSSIAKICKLGFQNRVPFVKPV